MSLSLSPKLNQTKRCCMTAKCGVGDTVQFSSASFAKRLPSVNKTLCSPSHTHTHKRRWLILWFAETHTKKPAHYRSVSTDWRQRAAYSLIHICMSLLGACSRKSSDVSYCRYVLWVGRALEHITEEREKVRERRGRTGGRASVACWSELSIGIMF